MKIGILTMKYRRNYGGILQCLALQNTLRKMGHEVEVIQFWPSLKVGFFYKVVGFVSSYRSIYQILLGLKEHFVKFRKPNTQRSNTFLEQLVKENRKFISTYINYTKEVDEYSISQVANDYEAIVVGSDKIWTGLAKKKLSYFFDWEPEYRGLRISYAPCSSNQKVPFFKTRHLKHLLAQFDAISVRDCNTQNIVNEITGMIPEIVVDPTLLYDFSELIEQRVITDPYLFVYILGDRIKGGHDKVLSNIRKVHGKMKIVAIVIADESNEALSFADEVIYNATPKEWLNLIYYASFIYTDSYHGCIFSIKYEKNFLSYYSSISRSTRLQDLKNRYLLNHHVLASADELDYHGESSMVVDYSKITQLIHKDVISSKAFITRALALEK